MCDEHKPKSDDCETSSEEERCGSDGHHEHKSKSHECDKQKCFTICESDICGRIRVKRIRGCDGEMGPRGYQGIQGIQGSQGFQGYQGFQGLRGFQGFQGFQGLRGFQGFQGDQGIQGFQGDQGLQGIPGGDQGYQGDQGPQGDQGDQGLPGLVGATLGAADFYAIMPGDNATAVAAGANVEFPNDGPNTSAGGITGAGTTFPLFNIGTYLVQFQVSVDEPGQLVIKLNGGELAYTVVGRATGTSQIVGMSLVTTTAITDYISIGNPAGNPIALTITPVAGGAQGVSAHLVIIQMA